MPKLYDIKAKISRNFVGEAKTSTVFKTATNKLGGALSMISDMFKITK